MTEVERKEYILYRLEKAEETLKAAELLIEHENWNSSVNRLYYAAYYAVSALLIQAQISTKTHSGVKTQFFLHYIKPGLIEKEFSKVYSDLFDWRQKGDYADFFDFVEDDIKTIFTPTKKLIQKVKGLIFQK